MNNIINNNKKQPSYKLLENTIKVKPNKKNQTTETPKNKTKTNILKSQTITNILKSQTITNILKPQTNSTKPIILLHDELINLQNINNKKKSK